MNHLRLSPMTYTQVKYNHRHQAHRDTPHPCRLTPHTDVISGEASQQQQQQQQQGGLTTMDELAALMSQAMATKTMAVVAAPTAAPAATSIGQEVEQSSGHATTANGAGTPVAAAAAAAAALPPPPIPSAQNPATVDEINPPRPPGQNNSHSTFLEASTAFLKLYNEHPCEVDGRCPMATKPPRVASPAVAGPGGEDLIVRSYKAYSHAYCSLKAAERLVVYAEERGRVADDNRRKAGEAVRAAESELARATATLRGFGVDVDDRSRSSCLSPRLSSYSCSCSPANKEKHDKKKTCDDEDDDDGDNHEGATSSPSSPPLPPSSPLTAVAALAYGGEKRVNSTNETEKKTSDTRGSGSLDFALESASGISEKTSTDRRCAQGEADDTLTLVGARTAGECPLPPGICDEVNKKRFQAARGDAVSDVQKFTEGARPLRRRNKLGGDMRQRSTAALQAREVARVAAAESVAAGVARRVSSSTATAVEAAAAAAAASSSRETGETSGGDGAGYASFSAHAEEGEEGETRTDDLINDEGSGEEGVSRWMLRAAPCGADEEHSGEQELRTETARASSAAANKRYRQKKRKRI